MLRAAHRDRTRSTEREGRRWPRGQQLKVAPERTHIAFGPHGDAVGLTRRARHKTQSVGQHPNTRTAHVHRGEHLAWPLASIWNYERSWLFEHLGPNRSQTKQQKTKEYRDATHTP